MSQTSKKKRSLHRITEGLAGGLFLTAVLCSCSKKEAVMNQFPVQKSEAEWRSALTPEQYRILREAGTERPFSGVYTDHESPGVYRCAGC